MTTTVTYDLNQLDTFAKRLREQRDPDAIHGLTEGLADIWIATARREVGVDTGQLRARTNLVSIRATAGRGHAVLHADTPYAGYHNYGTRYTRPNRFWNNGMNAAERRAQQLEGAVFREIARALESGGVWNPRALF